ncbi:MAG: LysM peptidoglycan-binding domain-containing protein [Lachnospiraceae bacterium]|nr:LysM peptidoglycan-binding domain-containing protein [Lachnospiraceae bacterium]
MRNIYIGDAGVTVQYMQLALKRAGYDIAVNGEFTRDTCRILGEFLGEKVGCYVDTSVWPKLMPYLRGYTTHIVAQGESLWSIAEAYHTSLSSIVTANPSVEPSNLQVGTRIYVPFSFALVSEEVPYTSEFTQLIIEGLAMRYPFLATGSIGRSVMNNELHFIRIGRGNTQVGYNASFHANEWITTPVLLKFAEEYAGAYADGAALYGTDSTELFENYSLYLIPMVNPDGVNLVNGALPEGDYLKQTKRIASEYSFIPYPSGWKANINGVDLNLQFPAGWEQARIIKSEQGYTSPAPREYVGEAPISQPESRAMYDFTNANDFQLILAYHTQGEVIYWKYLDYEPENSRRIAEYFGRVSGYLVEETPYASGHAGYKDWFIEQYNLPGYTIEAGIGENPLNMSQFAKIYENNKQIILGGMTQIVMKSS